MKKAEKKEVEVRAELYPLSKKEFEDLYNKAWENGWVYGKFFQELYYEYLVNWVYFIVYLDKLKMTNPKNVEILIGEAPPYWKGNAENKDKSYFYNPAQTNSSKWLNAPADWKSFGGKFKPKTKTTDLKSIKIEKLNFLAENGLILFDIFPFPIIQDTKIRQAVSGKFPEHINEYFIPKLNSIINYIRENKNNINIKYGFVATTYGSLHLLFGDKTRELLYGFNSKFYDNGIVTKLNVDINQFVFKDSKNTNQIKAFNKKNKPTALFNYIYKLICPAKDYVDNYVVNYVVNYVDVAIPIGGIIMWSTTSIPTNWQLCDGSPIPGGNPYANTPDLRDRFVYGWGSNSASLKGIGPQPDGQSLVTLNIDQIPAHTHQSYVNFSETEVAGSEGGSNVAGATPVTASTDTTSIGSNGQHNNMPPYYVLAFIMRIA